MQNTFCHHAGKSLKRKESITEFYSNMNHLIRKRLDHTRVFLYIIFISLLLAVSVTTAASAFTITATAGSYGSMDPPSGPHTVNPDGSLMFWITPWSGYHSVLLIDGEKTSFSEGPYPFNNVQADHTLSVTFVPDTGSLEVKSDPYDAIIYIDDVNVGNVGKTGTTVGDVLVGPHKLRLTLEGHVDSDTNTWTVVKGETTKVPKIYLVKQTTPAPITGVILVSSVPVGAKIYLDDTDTGLITPATKTGVSPGLRTIRCSLSGYSDKSQSVTVTAVTDWDLSE